MSGIDAQSMRPAVVAKRDCLGDGGAGWLTWLLGRVLAVSIALVVGSCRRRSTSARVKWVTMLAVVLLAVALLFHSWMAWVNTPDLVKVLMSCRM